MRITVQVKPGQRTDRLWRSGAGLVAHIRAVADDRRANAYLLRFVAGELRVPQSLVSITKGRTTPYKVLSINVPEDDLRPQLARLTASPPESLFATE
jgi:uncharacterized protein YggU (UPF0235/DUF167 family)